MIQTYYTDYTFLLSSSAHLQQSSAVRLLAVVQRHALRCGALQHLDFSVVLIGERNHRSREPQSCALYVPRDAAKVAGDFGSCLVEGLSDRSQRVGLE
jgi:hypothetical protein